MPLSGEGVLDGRASVLSGDPDSPGVAQAPDATWAITDGNQRRSVAFGAIRYNESYLLGQRQTLPGHTTGVPLSFAVVTGQEHQTVSAPVGAVSVSASSFGATPLVYVPTLGPAAAFDDDPNSAWVASVSKDSVGQWVAITFDKPIRLSTIKVRPLAGQRRQPTISAVRITTDRGTVTRYMPLGKKTYTLSVAPGESRHLKITLAGVRPAPPVPPGSIVLGAGISGISIPGVSYQQRMLLPDDEAAAFSSAAAEAPVVDLNRPIPNQNLSLGLLSTDDPDMSRVFALPKAGTYTAFGTAVPQPGRSLDDLIGLLTAQRRGSLAVTASSTLGDLPRFRAENLINKSNRPWIADIGDRRPSLSLTWGIQQPVDSVSLVLTPGVASPTKVSITPGGGPTYVRSVPQPRHADVATVNFPSTVTNSLTVRFIGVTRRLSVTPNFGVGIPIPVGLQSLSLPGLITVGIAPTDMNRRFTLSCGEGPTVDLDGKPTETSVTGTIGELVNLDPVLISVCTPTGGLQLQAGTHGFEAESAGAQFLPTSIVVQPAHAPSTAHLAHRSAEVENWGADSRSVAVGAGPATYLVLAQNYNSGWVAHLGGKTLKPVRVDGWEQGYLIPAGRAGTITLSMQANVLFQLILVVGAALLIALLVLALVPSRRENPAALRTRPHPSFWLLLGLSVAALVIVAGPLALILLPLLAVARRLGPTPMAVAAFVAFMAAGVAAAWSPASPVRLGADAFGSVAQITSVTALAAVLAALVAESWTPDPPYASGENEFIPEEIT